MECRCAWTIQLEVFDIVVSGQCYTCDLDGVCVVFVKLFSNDWYVAE